MILLASFSLAEKPYEVMSSTWTLKKPIWIFLIMDLVEGVNPRMKAFMK